MRRRRDSPAHDQVHSAVRALGQLITYVRMNKPIQRSLLVYAPYLPCYLEGFEVPHVVIDDTIDLICRDRCVCHLRGIREPWDRKVERPERKVAADNVRGWV